MNTENNDRFSASVGANVLDTLTTGMYTDARDSIREYIQNSLDSALSAESKGLLNNGEGKVEIRQKIGNELSIWDNGEGIPLDSAANDLLSIGKSRKKLGMNAGFRGIGRLAGIAYCDTLVFETSAIHEKVGTRVTFDCSNLRKYIDPQTDNAEATIQSVMRQSCNVEEYEENTSNHYFQVTLKGLKNGGEAFLDTEQLKEYLSQNCPLDYDSQRFIFASELRNKISNSPFQIPTINITLFSDDGQKHDIRKPYRGFYDTRNGKLEIENVIFFEDKSEKNRYWGWRSKSDLIGSIISGDSAGLRIRVKNILIGGPQLTSEFFSVESNSNSRFNRYYIGEIFLAPDVVIPNARRDGFEDREEWRSIRTELEEFADTLSAQVRASSSNRNKSISRIKSETEKLISETRNLLDDGFPSMTAKEKQIEKIKARIKNNESALKGDRSESDRNKIYNLNNTLQDIMKEVEDSKNFSVNTLNLSRKEKNVLKVVYEVLHENLDKKTCNKIMSEINSRLQKKSKRM